MEIRALPFALALALSILSSDFSVLGSVASAAAEQTAAQKPRAARPKPRREVKKPPSLPCGDVVSFAVLLDRQGFSPGQIDGIAGRNFTRALDAMRSSKQITATGSADCESWQALGGDSGDPAIVSYTI